MPGFDLGLPPRGGGLTHVIDKGLGTRAIEDLWETAGDYVDIVKLGWGTGYVTRNLERKIELYRSLGARAVFGGTFFEVVYAKGKVDEYKRWVADLGLTTVEISDGTVEIPRERKLELIAELARDFVVLSEVGSKDASVEFAPEEWTSYIREELEAGAWKVIAEARESGSAGIFAPGGEMRTGLVDDIAGAVDVADLIFEAPTKASQTWLIKRFGADVNLGNIPPDEVIALETLRLGLRGDTLKEVLLREQPASPS